MSVVVVGCYKTADDSFLPEEVNVDRDEELDRSIMEQNRWIYTSMDNEYYWCDQMPDSNKLDLMENASKFFNRLLYKQEDRFSWIEMNLDYNGTSLYANYGIDYSTYLAGNTEIHRVLYVDPTSDAAKAGIKRGDWFTCSLNANSADIRIGSLDDGVFVPGAGYTLMAAAGHTDAVKLDTIYRIGSKRVAYLFYNEFMDEPGVSNQYRRELNEIFARFNQASVTDFIIDLRYNHGGYVSICEYLSSLILPDEYLGTISGYHEYNDKLAKEQLARTGNREDILYFPTKSKVDGNNLGVRKMYAIVTKNSASASESLVNNLSPCISVVKVGTTTYGKGVGSWTIKDDRYQWQMQPITFRYYNRNHLTVPSTGLVPDIFANESTVSNLYAIGDIREYLLNTTLSQITGGTIKSQSVTGDQKLDIQPVDTEPALHGRLHGLIGTRP